ncbi:MAG TPA: hypothetical protein VKA50_04645 [Gammaproteobacteria bacterium]|nr:hypothetical protein [Gammaproteobacteria bacterium]
MPTISNLNYTLIVGTCWLLALLAGCASYSGYHGPDGDTPPAFAHVNDLKAIEGTYRNAGDPKGYFSAVLWGEYPKGADKTPDSALDYFVVDGHKVFHKDIQVIDVAWADKDRIRVTARDGRGHAVKSEDYVLGQDFEIDDGEKVPVRNKMMLTAGPDDPVLGPKGFRVELGLNRKGDIVCRTRSWGYGLVYSLIPMGATDTTDWVFRRLPQSAGTGHR